MMMASERHHQTARTHTHESSDVDLEAQNHERSYVNNHTGGMMQASSNSLLESSNTTASTVYERDRVHEREPRPPAPIHHFNSNRAPAPAPIEIPRALPPVLAHTYSSNSLQPLTQATPQSSRSALILQKTSKRHRRSFVRRREQSSVCASCFPFTSRSPSIRSKVLQSFLCFLLLLAVFGVYLGLSLSNEHLSTGVQVPLMVLLILSGLLFVYVLLELCIFVQRASRVHGHHRLQSTVSFQEVDEQPRAHRRSEQQQGSGDEHAHAHHHNGRHKHKKHRKRRYRRGEYPRHQIPLSPDDVLPNDDAVYTPTTPVRVHLLHDEESVTLGEKASLAFSQASATGGGEGEEARPGATREMVDVSIDESMIHPSLRRAHTGDTIPIGPTSPMATTFAAAAAATNTTTQTQSGEREEEEEEAEKEVVVLGKAPPPAYGLWRCSVRADPNLLHWRRIDSLSTGVSSPSPSPGGIVVKSARVVDEVGARAGQPREPAAAAAAAEEEPAAVESAAADIAASMLRPTRYRPPVSGAVAATPPPPPPESEPPAYVSFVDGDTEQQQQPQQVYSDAATPGRETTNYTTAETRQDQAQAQDEEAIVMMLAMGSPHAITSTTANSYTHHHHHHHCA